MGDTRFRPHTLPVRIHKTCLPQLCKLKTLEVYESNVVILKCFSWIEFNKINLSIPADSSENRKTIVRDFLRTQNELTSLAVHSSNILDGTMPFKLTKLSMLTDDETIDHHNLSNFMEQQSKTITDLELENDFPDFGYEIVFSKFKNLKTFQLDIRFLPQDINFYNGLKESKSVEHLILTGTNRECSQSFIEFIRRLPNVTRLTLLEFCNGATVRVISSNLLHLQELSVKFFHKSAFGEVQFPRLTLLNIEMIVDDIDWDLFTKINSRITELNIQKMISAVFVVWNAEKLSKFLTKISENLTLTTLRIGSGEAESDRRIFDIIRKNFRTLKTLELCKSCVDDGQWELGDIPGLILHNEDFYAYKCNRLRFWSYDDEDDIFSDNSNDND